MRFCSNGGSNCLVVDRCPDGVSIDLHDSQHDPHADILHIPMGDFADFLVAARHGSTDHLVDADALQAAEKRYAESRPAFVT